MKPMTHVTDQKFVKAMAHPLRLRILGALEHRTASPSELAQELDAPLGNVSYHVRQLHGLGLLKLVKETPRRGAVEHYYRLERRPHITDKAWAAAPDIVKEAMLGGVLARVAEQVNEAVSTGGFDRADAHLSRLPMTFDAKGFGDAAREFGEFVKKLKQIEEESRSRLEDGEHDGELPTLVVLMMFEALEQAKAPHSTDGRATDGRRRKVVAAAD
jgi:DNA-binding transcriptional ArsR family regulator